MEYAVSSLVYAKWFMLTIAVTCSLLTVQFSF